jgi:hypothetical protein
MLAKATWLADTATGTRRFCASARVGVIALYGISHARDVTFVASMQPSTAGTALPVLVELLSAISTP